MSQLTISDGKGQCNSPFDAIRGFRVDGSEFWTGRELTKWLEYKEWRNGEKAIKRAIVSCRNNHQNPALHIVEVNKVVHRAGSGSIEINDYELSRFGCYLVAQNADPEKNMVAMAQGYFASKTYEAETIIPIQFDRIRELELQIELAKAEAQKSLAERSVLDMRHLIVSTCPEPLQQKILGFQVIKEVEYRDRIVKGNQIINDGNTINKTSLCERYGILTKNGKPDYKRLNLELAAVKIPESAWEETDVIQTNRELRREFLEELDRSIYTAEQRQIWLGED